VAHKGRAGPYLFERDLSLDFPHPFNLYEKYRLTTGQMLDGSLDAIQAPERVSATGSADYTAGEIKWTWSWVTPGGALYGFELRYKLTFDADMRIFATRARVGAVWTNWHDETSRPNNSASLNLGLGWNETILVGAFFHNVTVITNSIGLKQW